MDTKMNTTANETSGITFIDDLPFKRPPIYHMPPSVSRELLPPPPEGYLEALSYDLSKNDGSYWLYMDGYWSIQSVTLTQDKPLRGQSRVFAAIDDAD